MVIENSTELKQNYILESVIRHWILEKFKSAHGKFRFTWDETILVVFIQNVNDLFNERLKIKISLK